ncbi:MAG: hypothetical protein LBM98_06200 [Oscillospiraceae bacterium]|jgi:hypothetical protein|nr:hypothetical protein [Oscillospiraceae bacterium]
MIKTTEITVEEFDKLFDEGEEDITGYFDRHIDIRPNQDRSSVTVDFNLRLFNALDKEARKIGIPVYGLIKVWLAERLEKELVYLEREAAYLDEIS